MPAQRLVQHRRHRGRGADPRDRRARRGVGVVDAMCRRARASCRASRARSAAATATERMFDWPTGWVSVTAAPRRRARLRAADGPQLGRERELVAAGRLEGARGLLHLAVDEVSVPPNASGEQLVGLKMKFVRSIATLIARRRSGTPSDDRRQRVGLDGQVRVARSTRIAARTTTVPRSYGPAIARIATDSPNGAPL